MKDIPPKLTVLRRITLVLTDSHQNAKLAALGKEYDIIALRPVDERSLQLACGSLDCDIISLDFTQRLPYFFKFKTLSEAIKLGKKFEICYSQGLLGDSQGRRNVISNATQLIRASRGRGLIISSESKAGAAGLRGPWDVVNLAAVWGLGQERGVEGVGKECRSAVVTGKLKRSGYRGAVDVVYGGEKPASIEKIPAEKGKGKQQNQSKQQDQQKGQKRKAEGETAAGAEPPLSKRQAKKRAHEARMKAAENGDGAAKATTGEATTAATESAT
jgi:ribonuclease P/MRP protein subunit RPP1